MERFLLWLTTDPRKLITAFVLLGFVLGFGAFYLIDKIF
jgi:hypothetical protein